MKTKAILEQQVELLTMQLHEASAREKDLKTRYSTMINALKTEKQDAETEVRELRKTIKEPYLRSNPTASN